MLFQLKKAEKRRKSKKIVAKIEAKISNFFLFAPRPLSKVLFQKKFSEIKMLFAPKILKRHILTSVLSAQHPNAGLIIQQA